MVDLFYAKSKPKARGRPTGWRKQGGVVTTIRVSENLKAILESERNPEERYSDTVERMLYERTQKIQTLSQEIDRLKQTAITI